MSETKKENVYPVSKPGQNDIGTTRYWLLCAAANRAAEAFENAFYLEAITLTESLLATRLESRVAFVRECQKMHQPVKFSPLGPLCTELLKDDNQGVIDAEAFMVPIQKIKEWAGRRNEALHEMAKLYQEDGRDFSEKYQMSRDTVIKGFELLLAYDALDRKVRRAVGLYTATDDKKGATAFDCLIPFVKSS